MLKQGLNQKLLQKLSPQQIQYVQLLQLNTTELEKRLVEEIAENPALEMEKDKGETEGDFDQEPHNQQEIKDETSERIAEFTPNDDDQINRNAKNQSPDDKRTEIPVAVSKTMYDLMDEQLAAVRLSDKQREIGNHLIGMIETDGYLRRPLKNITFDMAFLKNMRVTVEELEEVLKIIQTFEPAGIGARDLQECLLIQIKQKKASPQVELARELLEKCMDELGKRHYDKIIRKLKIDKACLQDVLQLIQRLNPKPGFGEESHQPKSRNIDPDFVVTEEDGRFKISLNSKNAPQLSVSKAYEEVVAMSKKEKEQNERKRNEMNFIKQKIEDARWFIDAVKQREDTLMKTMETILKIQKSFFKTGDLSKLKPMILKDVAEVIGMDISTVSRVASSKYVETDYGIFSLKEFFSEAIEKQDGTQVSNREVKALVKKYIDEEDKSKPITDEKLTQMLKADGYLIARRTVAKYREMLKIPVARLRKAL